MDRGSSGLHSLLGFVRGVILLRRGYQVLVAEKGVKKVDIPSGGA